MNLAKLKELLRYDPCTGSIDQIYNAKVSTIDDYGFITVYEPVAKARHKIKADKAAWMLGNNKTIRSDQRILHKNLDARDLTLKNLVLISKGAYLDVVDAVKNLEGSLRIVPHHKDMFNYFLYYRDKGKENREICYDIIQAKKKYLKLQLKAAKIVSKYCIVE